MQKSMAINALAGLTPSSLVQQILEFKSGYLRNFSLTMGDIEESDDTIFCVVNKRKGSIKRRSYEILAVDGADEKEAELHSAALEYFYSNLECKHGVDGSQMGGWSLLVDTMMNSVSQKYAVHEVLWKPTPEGLTATFVFVPLHFFEAKTGKLRFLKSDFSIDGIDLEEIAPGGWMVTCAPCAMIAGSRNYLIKILAIRNWMLYNERHGVPGIEGKTDSAKDSSDWDDLVTAVEAVAAGFACVHNKNDEIGAIQFGAQGELPMPKLVERMDKGIATIWRGADLSTLSSGTQSQGTGASLQGDETDVVEQGDAQLISETLQQQIDRKVIAYTFGEGVKPAAYIKIVIPDKKDTAKEIAVDTFLVDHGVKLGVAATAERYGRPVADEEDDLLTSSVPTVSPFGASPRGPGVGLPGSGEIPTKDDDAATLEQAAAEATDAAANVDPATLPDNRLEAKARIALSKAFAHEFSHLRVRLEAISLITDTKVRDQKLAILKGDLRGLLADINRDPEAARVIEQSMVAAFFNGLEKGKKTAIKN